MIRVTKDVEVAGDEKRDLDRARSRHEFEDY